MHLVCRVSGQMPQRSGWRLFTALHLGKRFASLFTASGRAVNERISIVPAHCPMGVDAIGSQRNYIMDKRGKGVPIIVTGSEKLSGKKPEYRLLDDSELMLAIFAAGSPHGED